MADPSQDNVEQGGALKRHVEHLRSIQGALLDACAVVDREQRVAGFNRSFFALFPRRVARTLEGSRLGDLLELRFNEEPFDPIEACLERVAAVRFDEIEGVGPDGVRFHFIVTASPLLEADAVVGVLVLLRDVTDEVQIQSKYQSMLHEEANARAKLEGILKARTGELLAANDALNALQIEVGRYACGLLLPDPTRIEPEAAADAVEGISSAVEGDSGADAAGEGADPDDVDPEDGFDNVDGDDVDGDDVDGDNVDLDEASPSAAAQVGADEPG